YQRKELKKAIRTLERLLKKYPKNADLNYTLALFYRVRGDKKRFNLYYDRFRKFHPELQDDSNYPNISNLSKEMLARLLSPEKVSSDEYNLRIELKRIEESFQRQKFEEARILFTNAERFYPQARKETQNQYHFMGLRLYDQLGDEYRYQALLHFRKMNSELLSPPNKKLFEQNYAKWKGELQKFQQIYRHKTEVNRKKGELLNNQEYEKLLLFIELVYPYYQDSPQYLTVLELDRLEGLIHLKRLSEARQLRDSLANAIMSDSKFYPHLNRLTQTLINAETEIKIAKARVKADSLMLWGKYKEGLLIYGDLLQKQTELNLNPDYIYLSLAHIHRDIARFNEARKFLEKISPANVLLKDSITVVMNSIKEAETFEQRWKRSMQRVTNLMADHQYQRAEREIIDLVNSPYLRFGLKDSTFSTLASIYAELGRFAWANELLLFAQQFSQKPALKEKQRLKINEFYKKNKLYPLPHPYRQPVLFEIDYPNTIQFSIQEMKLDPQSLDRWVGKEWTVTSGDKFYLEGGKRYRIVFNEKKEKTNFLTAVGIFVSGSLFFISR
ncbi:MAG: hypothetical protein D6813_13220, partial [Calditrichaeota bacterium]